MDPWQIPLYNSIFPIFVSYSLAKYQFMQELLNLSGIFTERPLEISAASFHLPHCTRNSHPEQLPGFHDPNRPGVGSELRYKEQLYLLEINFEFVSTRPILSSDRYWVWISTTGLLVWHGIVMINCLLPACCLTWNGRICLHKSASLLWYVGRSSRWSIGD